MDHIRDLSVQRQIGPYNFALIYAGRGDTGKAFEWLNRADDARSYLPVESLNTDARLANLHDDSRFSMPRNRVGLPASGAKVLDPATARVDQLKPRPVPALAFSIDLRPSNRLGRDGKQHGAKFMKSCQT